MYHDHDKIHLMRNRIGPLDTTCCPPKPPEMPMREDEYDTSNIDREVAAYDIIKKFTMDSPLNHMAIGFLFVKNATSSLTACNCIKNI